MTLFGTSIRRLFLASTMLLAGGCAASADVAAVEPTLRLVEPQVLDRLRAIHDEQTLEFLESAPQVLSRIVQRLGATPDLCGSGVSYRFVRRAGRNPPMMVEVHIREDASELVAIAPRDGTKTADRDSLNRSGRVITRDEAVALMTTVEELGLWNELPLARPSTYRDGGDVWMYQLCRPGQRHFLRYMVPRDEKARRLGRQMTALAYEVIPSIYRDRGSSRD